MTRRFAFLSSLLAPVFGQQSPKPAVSPKPTEIPSPSAFFLKKLYEDMAELRTALDQLKADVGEMSIWAYLDLSKSGYVSHLTNLGPVLIRGKKAEPYLDGMKIFLELGNPTNSDWNDLEYTVFVQKNLVTTRGNLSGVTLERGKWTPVEIVVPRTDAKDARLLKLKIYPGGVIL